MPYKVGGKGTNGCSGFPVVDEKGKVVGCHPTKEKAVNHMQALYANVPDASKADVPATCDCIGCSASCECGDCATCGGTDNNESSNEKVSKQSPCWEGYVQRGMKPGKDGKMVPNCVPAEKIDDLWEDDDTVVYETDSMSKADGYSPPAGARSAARRAIKFKEDGKANGAGTAVGWTRARQLANGESLSLSTVKRMYSYFSRHEVDKKGKDWGNTANPSNGYIMWLAWGGDAGFAWSRRIVNAEKDKSLFADFGKTFSRAQQLTEVFKRDYSPKERQRMAAAGMAMPDGSYPIANEADLRNAIQSIGRATNYLAVRRHIKHRAQVLGLISLLPEKW